MCVGVVPLTIAATAITALGQGYSALSSSAQSKYESRVAHRNARMENERAADARLRGVEELQRFGRKASQEAGQQNAALAANGIDLGFGSAADIRGDTATFAREDSRTIQENSMREARGYEINASNFVAEARGKRAMGRAARVQGAFDMGGTILGGATQVAWYKARPGW